VSFRWCLLAVLIAAGGGFAPSLKTLPPLLLKERGIKGVRLVNNF